MSEQETGGNTTTAWPTSCLDRRFNEKRAGGWEQHRRLILYRELAPVPARHAALGILDCIKHGQAVRRAVVPPGSLQHIFGCLTAHPLKRPGLSLRRAGELIRHQNHTLGASVQFSLDWQWLSADVLALPTFGGAQYPETLASFRRPHFAIGSCTSGLSNPLIKSSCGSVQPHVLFVRQPAASRTGAARSSLSGVLPKLIRTLSEQAGHGNRAGCRRFPNFTPPLFG